jgi:prephenate dehydrogenase
MPARVAFLGFGLIGGSIARALRERGAGAGLVGWSPSGDGPAAAVADGVLDGAARSPVAALEGAELVVLAAPPLRCLELIDGLAGPWRDRLGDAATVTDVASTKVAVCGRAEAAGLRFVGGHPMAGSETSGYAAGRADLFEGRPWVIVPAGSANAGDVARVEWLAAATGAHPVRMADGEHDEVVAAISHLPLLVSSALVEAVVAWAGGSSDPAAPARLAASGWRDVTRLALGDPAMGAGILATNAGPVAMLVERLVDVLADWTHELERPEGPDPERLERRLVEARERLEAMREAAGR